MDRLPGLGSVFRDEFPMAKMQRRQVHVARNIISKVRHGTKDETADRLPDLYYAPIRSEAKRKFDTFGVTYCELLPAVVKSLEAPIKEC